MQLQLFEVFAFSQPDVAALLRDQREIEVGEPYVGLGGDRFFDEALGAGNIALLERNDAERVSRRGDVGVELERVVKELLRTGEISAVHPDLAHLIVDEWILGVD